ncbi:MAG: hypothetical protein IID53_03185 [Proteobacteria bacterium]|nr:hypothetical protein [Pseudomonadota bacterium]
MRFIVRFLAGDFFLTIRFLETAFFAGFRLAVVFFFSVRFLATTFFAAFFTVLGFFVSAFEPRDVVLLVAISHLNYFLLHIRTGGKYTKCTTSTRRNR